jgi:hypothetical protein
MFFRTPDDLTNIDFANGGCRNETFAQNVTFEYQGLPNLNLGNAAGARLGSSALAAAVAGVVALLVGVQGVL